MLKHLAVTLLALGCGVGGNVLAGEMSMPGAAFIQAGGSETETAGTVARSDAGSSGAMHETGSDNDGAAAHVRMQPDSVAGARTNTVRAAVGTDTASTAEVGGTAAHKTHRTAHWQSLLPGVMK
jgi:hypothetical protein